MRLRSITLSGFRSFAETETIDLSGITLGAVVGPNHSGKTSILRGIEYALYGPAHGEARSLVNRDSSAMQVALALDVSGSTYTITRSHRGDGTGHKVSVVLDGEQVSSRDLATTQTYINDLIGMDRDVARATWMAMQGDIESLAQMDGPSRRAVFTSAFGLERFEPLARAAKAERKKVSEALADAQGRLSGLSSAITLDPALSHLDDEGLTDAIDTLALMAEERSRANRARAEVDRLAPAVDRAEEAVASFPYAVEALDWARRNAEEARESLAQAQSRASARRAELDAVAARPEVAALTEELSGARARVASAGTGPVFNDLREALTTARIAEQSAASLVSELSERLSVVGAAHDGTCENCGQHLSPQALDHMRTTATESLARVRDEHEAAVAGVAGASAALDEAVVRDRTEAEAALAEVVDRHREVVESASKEAREGLAAAEDAVREALTAQRAAESELAVAQRNEREASRSADARDRLVAELGAARAEMADAESSLAALTVLPGAETLRADDLVAERTLRRAVADNTAVAAGLRTEVSQARDRLEALDLLVSAFSPSGIPMTILSATTEEVAHDANDLLDDMGSPLQVSIDASGSGVDLVVDGSEWSSLSGQERFFVALSLRLSLGRAVARRVGSGIGTMLLDEGWGSLDEDHAQRAVDALSALTDRVSILTVTHVESVGEQAPMRIEVDATSGTSRATRVG